ncbi:MAG: RNA 2',3'-cyclic phosphodiesterase [Burkholderiaceae bacterium]|nr:RNA 2',3'-cyclic phosphodiesterase [Burkholderiaceae bacterium]
MTSLRLFVALWPTLATRAAAVAAQEALRWPAGARRMPASDLHLTLAFIGAQPQEQLGHVSQAAGVASATIQLTLDRLEIWKGGTLVLRPSRLPAAIVDLQARLTASLQACGVPFDARPFAPHLTLGRKARGIEEVAGFPVPWRSTGHVLALSAGGSYRVIARFA